MSDTNFSAIRARLRYESIEEFIDGYARFISAGGMFIPMSAKKLKPIGTTIRFQFLLDDGATALLGEGAVVQVRPPEEGNPKAPVGMLIKFSKLSQESKNLVDQIVAMKEFGAVGETPNDAEPDVEPEGEDDAEDPTHEMNLDQFIAEEEARAQAEAEIAAAEAAAVVELSEPEEEAPQEEVAEVAAVSHGPRKLGQTEGGLQILAFDDISEEEAGAFQFDLGAQESDIDDMFAGLFGGGGGDDAVFGDMFGPGEGAAEEEPALEDIEPDEVEVEPSEPADEDVVAEPEELADEESDAEEEPELFLDDDDEPVLLLDEDSMVEEAPVEVSEVSEVSEASEPEDDTEDAVEFEDGDDERSVPEEASDFIDELLEGSEPLEDSQEPFEDFDELEEDFDEDMLEELPHDDDSEDDAEDAGEPSVPEEDASDLSEGSEVESLDFDVVELIEGSEAEMLLEDSEPRNEVPPPMHVSEADDEGGDDDEDQAEDVDLELAEADGPSELENLLGNLESAEEERDMELHLPNDPVAALIEREASEASEAAEVFTGPEDEEESLDFLLAAANASIASKHPDDVSESKDVDILDDLLGAGADLPPPPVESAPLFSSDPEPKKKKGFLSKLFGKD